MLGVVRSHGGSLPALRRTARLTIECPLPEEKLGALLRWSLENCAGSERGLPGRHVLNSRHEFQPALVGCFKIEKAIATNTIGRTAAQTSVSGLGIQNRYGPDHEVVLATIEQTIYNRCV